MLTHRKLMGRKQVFRSVIHECTLINPKTLPQAHIIVSPVLEFDGLIHTNTAHLMFLSCLFLNIVGCLCIFLAPYNRNWAIFISL